MSSQLAARPAVSARICHVPPSVGSAGADALELCELAGLTLDDWQRFVLEQALGEREDKRWSAFEVGLVCARQNGKSELLVARLLVGAFLLGGREQIYSAHLFDSAMVVFRRLVGVVEDTPSFMRRVRRINRAHGSESIELKSGGRISFRTRTNLGARGHTCDALVLDEAHVLTTAAHGSLLQRGSAPVRRSHASRWRDGRGGGAPRFTSSQHRFRGQLAGSTGRHVRSSRRRSPAGARPEWGWRGHI